jgi:hypothetical protein
MRLIVKLASFYQLAQARGWPRRGRVTASCDEKKEVVLRYRPQKMYRSISSKARNGNAHLHEWALREACYIRRLNDDAAQKASFATNNQGGYRRAIDDLGHHTP